METVVETKIHQTAVVDPTAQLGAGVEIGPYCVIGAGVQLGDRCVLSNHVTISGPSTIGSGNRFFPQTVIGEQTQDLKYQGEPTFLEIGDNNSFREFCTVHRGTMPGSKTIVGSEGNFLSYSHIAHDCVVGNHVIFSNNGTLGGHVQVEDYVIVGGFAGVHQYCRIGKHSILGGCSKIVQDVPPFMIADGNPARARGINKVGLERHGFDSTTLKELKEAYRTLYRSKDLNHSQAVEQMEQNQNRSEEVKFLAQWVKQSERGIIA